MKHFISMLLVAILFLSKSILAQSPIISSFTPKGNCKDLTTSLQIFGNNLAGTTSVMVGNTITNIIGVNSNKVSVTVPANTSGAISIITPNGITISSDSFRNVSGYADYAYVGAGGGTQNYLSVIDCNSNNVISKINLGGTPTLFCSSPDGKYVYALINSSVIDVISTTSSSIVTQIPLSNSPQSICISPDGTRLYLANNDNTLSIINTKTNSVISILTLSNSTSHGGMCISPDGSKLYLTNYNYNDSCNCFLNQSVSTFNTVTNTVTSTVNVGQGDGALQICMSPNGTKLYVVQGLPDYQNGVVSVIDAFLNSVIATVSVGVNPKGICVSPDGETVYVLNSNAFYFGGSVSFINTSNYTVFADVPVDMNPDAFSISSDGTKIYAANLIQSYYGTVSVINTLNQTVIAKDTVGQFPNCTTIANVPTSCNSLPITVVELEAIRKNNIIEFNWQTASELNASHFIVNHSTDGKSFKEIGRVNANGSGANSYEFTDITPANGINYFRLECVDNDGSRSYSKVVSVNFGDKQSFSIFPNPARDFTTISLSKSVNKASISVFDVTGKQVIEQSFNTSMSTYNLNTQSLKSGVYVIKVNTTTSSYIEKLLINRVL